LAKQARRVLNLLDDTPIVPGDTHQAFANGEHARQILNDAEDELRSWQPNLEPIHSTAGNLGVGAMPGYEPGYGGETGQEGEHPAYREKASRSRSHSDERRGASIGSAGPGAGGEVQPHYTEAERREVAQAGVV
jgi:hypothetical protein